MVFCTTEYAYIYPYQTIAFETQEMNRDFNMQVSKSVKNYSKEMERWLNILEKCLNDIIENAELEYLKKEGENERKNKN